MVLAFQVVHGAIEPVEELVAEEVVINEVELATGVGKRVAVSLTREVHPPAPSVLSASTSLLWVAKLVALEVEVGLTTKGVSKEASDQ